MRTFLYFLEIVGYLAVIAAGGFVAVQIAIYLIKKYLF